MCTENVEQITWQKMDWESATMDKRKKQLKISLGDSCLGAEGKQAREMYIVYQEIYLDIIFCYSLNFNYN